MRGLAKWLLQSSLGVMWHTLRWSNSTEEVPQPEEWAAALLWMDRMLCYREYQELQSTFQYHMLWFKAVMYKTYCSESKEPVLLY